MSKKAIRDIIGFIIIMSIGLIVSLVLTYKDLIFQEKVKQPEKIILTIPAFPKEVEIQGPTAPIAKHAISDPTKNSNKKIKKVNKHKPNQQTSRVQLQKQNPNAFIPEHVVYEDIK